MTSNEFDAKFTKIIQRKLANGYVLSLERSWFGYDGDAIEISLVKDDTRIDYYTKLIRVEIDGIKTQKMCIVEQKNSNKLHDQERIVLTFEPDIKNNKKGGM